MQPGGGPHACQAPSQAQAHCLEKVRATLLLSSRGLVLKTLCSWARSAWLEEAGDVCALSRCNPVERSDSDFSPPPAGPAEVLGAMMGGLEQDPCIIACRLCHISLTLGPWALNPWLPIHESFRAEKESAELMPMRAAWYGGRDSCHRLY